MEVCPPNVFLQLLLLIGLNYGCAFSEQVLYRTAYGLSDEQIPMSCDLPGYDYHTFTWKDLVYNEKLDPNIIYNSSVGHLEEKYRDRGFSISGKELYAKDNKYDVSGQYFCDIDLSNGTTLQIVYNIGTISGVECSEDQDVKEGEPVSLQCNYTTVISTAPYWKVDKQIYYAEHQSDFNTHTLTTVFNASSSHHAKTYVCIIENAEICATKLSVRYKVKDVDFPDKNKNIYAGDNITCQALGNPLPEVTLSLLGAYYTRMIDKGRSSLIIDENLIGKNVTIKCEAWNEVDGVRTMHSDESTFLVVEKPVEYSTLIEKNNGSLLMIIIIAFAVVVVLVVIIIIVVTAVKTTRWNKNQESKVDATLLKAESRKDYKTEMI